MKQHTVLIVAEEAETRMHLVGLLAGIGLRAKDVVDTGAALRYLRVRTECALVIGQLSLFEGQGFAALQTMSHQHPEVPVILFGNTPQVGCVIEAFRNGAFDFIAWPARAAAWQVATDAALEHALMRRQSLSYRENLEQLILERTAKLRATMTDLERSYDVTLEAMGDALDLRDAETQGHSKRVTAYTIALARAMHVSAAELKVIARGAFLHDIGKIAIPDSILLKPGKLSVEEMLVMREHCQQGYEIVRKIPFLAEAAEIVFAHQEAFDGSGYPRGLRGNEIPLGARIFAIADTLDAMTSERPYRRALSFAQAVAEIERCSETQFDPAIVKVFLSLPRETWSIIRAQTDRNAEAAELFRAVAA